jgi:hypothetical protein
LCASALPRGIRIGRENDTFAVSQASNPKPTSSFSTERAVRCGGKPAWVLDSLVVDLEYLGGFCRGIAAQLIGDARFESDNGGRSLLSDPLRKMPLQSSTSIRQR